jgi:hypothetical protein
MGLRGGIIPSLADHSLVAKSRSTRKQRLTDVSFRAYIDAVF